MKTFERYFVATNKWLLIAILAVMSVIIFANVVLRYTTNVYIAVENLQDSLPRPFSIAIRALIGLLLVALFVFFAWFGLEYMDRTQYQQTPATQISFAYIYAALPIGAAMSLIHWLLIVKDYVIDRQFAADDHFDATASASL